jgi:uroporphyrinogen decarboxylase
MGFDEFCFALVDQPDLIAAMFKRVGDIQLEVFRRIVEMDEVGAMWYGDDLAYRSGTIIHPDILRRHLFPYLSEMGALCREHDLPFVIHSDGNLWKVLPDLVACGLNAIHPVEPKAMDSAVLKREYGAKLCLLGNIEIGETLTLGSPQDVEVEVRDRIRALAPGGGYAVGSSNTVAHYVKLENFKAMVRATRAHGRYPISL